MTRGDASPGKREVLDNGFGHFKKKFLFFAKIQKDFERTIFRIDVCL